MGLKVKFHETARRSLREWRVSLGETKAESEKWYSILMGQLHERLRAHRGLPPEATLDNRFDAPAYIWWFGDVAMVTHLRRVTGTKQWSWWNPRGWFGSEVITEIEVTVIGWTPNPAPMGGSRLLRS